MSPDSSPISSPISQFNRPNGITTTGDLIWRDTGNWYAPPSTTHTLSNDRINENFIKQCLIEGCLATVMLELSLTMPLLSSYCCLFKPWLGSTGNLCGICHTPAPSYIWFRLGLLTIILHLTFKGNLCLSVFTVNYDILYALQCAWWKRAFDWIQALLWTECCSK